MTNKFSNVKCQILKFEFWILFEIWVWSFVILPSHAQLKELTINADRVSFEKEKNLIEAEGSAEVVYKDFYLSGNYLIYNTSKETIFAERGFSLSYEGISIEGDTLDYAIKLKKGEASQVKFLYQGIQLGGKKIKLEVDKIHLKNADFTPCDLPDTHYRVTAADVILYPKYGWLVAYWGFFWLGRFPVVPLPTYIYDFRAEEKGAKNLPPFPEVGSNPEDGNYINERLVWHLRREFSGTYSLGWVANKGLLLGINANYIVDDRNEGDLRLDWNSVNQTVGGVTHRFSFGDEIAARGAFLVLPHSRQYELETTLSARERINYQRVSFYPNFRLRSRGAEIMRKEAKYDLELMGGMVAEEGNTRLLRGGGKVKFYGDFQETSLGYLTPSLIIDSLFYSNGQKWVKPSLGLNLKKSFFPDLSLELGYLHYFFIEGRSPFNFEMYRFRAADRLGSSLLFQIGETGAQIAASYYLDNWSPEDIDCSLFFKLHCYNLAVTYRSLRQEFTIGFSLAPR